MSGCSDTGGCGVCCSGQHPGYTEGALVTLSVDDTAPSLIRFGSRRAEHSRARGPRRPLPLPPRAMLSHVLLEAVERDLETPPTSVTWWLTADPEGCVVLTDAVSSSWVASTVATYGGGVSARLDQVWVQGLHADELYLWVYSDIEVEVRPRVTWYTLSDLDLTREHRELIVEQAGG